MNGFYTARRRMLGQLGGADAAGRVGGTRTATAPVNVGPLDQAHADRLAASRSLVPVMDPAQHAAQMRDQLAGTARQQIADRYAAIGRERRETEEAARAARNPGPTATATASMPDAPEAAAGRFINARRRIGG